MIELISVTNNNVKHFAAVGITVAELPVKDLGTGSTCMMLDTGKKYIYFEGNESWYEDHSGSGGGGGGDVKAALSIDPEMVNFIDYDGTVVEQWSLDSLQKKTELPAFPEHTGLTAQNWNWTVEDIQAFGKPNVVGMLYVTDDGWSRFYLDIAERKEIAVSVGVSGTQEIEIDWGDGTKETVTVEYSKVLKHVYPSSLLFHSGFLPQWFCPPPAAQSKSPRSSGKQKAPLIQSCHYLQDYYSETVSKVQRHKQRPLSVPDKELSQAHRLPDNEPRFRQFPVKQNQYIRISGYFHRTYAAESKKDKSH